MRFILLLFLIILPLNASADKPEWYYLNSNLQKVVFTSSTSMYTVGTNGVILRSTNKGKSWQQIATGLSNALFGIAFSDSLHGTAVGENGVILKSSDAGLSWKIQLQEETKKRLSSVMFYGEKGIIIGEEGNTFLSTNGGITWIYKKISTNEDLYSLGILVDGTILIGASGGLVFRSTDYGNSWDNETTKPISSVDCKITDISISAENSTYALAVNGPNSYLFVSKDNGKIWSINSIDLPDNTTAISFPNNDFGVSVCTYSRINISTDGGLDFFPCNGFDTALMSTSDLSSITFFDKKIGVAVGFSKTIYRTEDGGIHWNLVSFLADYGQRYSSVQFITEDSGFVGGSNGLVFRTFNGGSTWLPQKRVRADISVTGSTVGALFYYDTQIGIACPDLSAGVVLRSTDGGYSYSENKSVTADYPKIHSSNPNLTFITSSYLGTDQVSTIGVLSISLDKGKTWNRKIFDSLGLLSVFCASNTHLYCTGFYQTKTKQVNYTLFSSKDSGQTFEKKMLPSFIKSVGPLYHFDENNGFACAQDTLYHPVLLRTEDGFNTWIVVDSSSKKIGFMTSITFTDRLQGYITDVNGVISETTDGGKTWRNSSSPESSRIYSFSAVNQDVAYAVGGKSPSGFVLKKLHKSFYSSVAEATIDVSPTVWLYTPRPVPSSGKVQIDAIWVQNLDVSSIKIKLFNMLGVEINDISTSLFANKGSNTGIIEFDGSNLLSGIYYIEIRGGGGRMSVPIMISK